MWCVKTPFALTLNWVEMEFFSAGVFDQVQTMSEGFTGGSDSKESACNAADLGSIPGLGRSPGVKNGSSILA